MDETISELAAALLLGISPQLLRAFTQGCPKTGETKVLEIASDENGILSFAKDKLLDFDSYLREKWPSPSEDTRASIPEDIRSEIRREARFGCAICRHANNVEVAHIKSWKASKCNHPHNLLLLCPNHHTQYDYGHKLHDSLKMADVHAIKSELIQASRYKYQAMLQPASSAIRLTKTIEKLNKTLESVDKDNASGLENLASELINASDSIERVETKDATLNKANEDASKALEFARKKMKESSVRSVLGGVSKVASDYDELLDSLDGYACPHCGGSGQIGLVGDLCVYCRGNGSVTQQELKEYNRDDIDQVECPRCNGNGTIGYRGELCAYCKGSQLVSKDDAENYDEDDIDEDDCPHCNGAGRVGLRGELCSYCSGDCVISKERCSEYNRDELDEVECPHCGGSGQQRSGDLCNYCFGDTYVDQEKYDAYARRFPDRV